LIRTFCPTSVKVYGVSKAEVSGRIEQTSKISSKMGRSTSPSENQIKARLLNELRRLRRISPSTIVANELPLSTGSVRADLAFCGKYFTGVEIKSDRDKLNRLARQLAVYREHFDRTIVVLGSKHLGEAKEIDLSDVEVWVASGLSLRQIQKTDSDLKMLQSNSRRLSRRAFCERFEVTSAAFWAETKNIEILSSHLPLLSRFVEKREMHDSVRIQTRKKREEWFADLVQSLHSSSVSKNEVSSP
jgi:hypothetical protein